MRNSLWIVTLAAFAAIVSDIAPAAAQDQAPETVVVTGTRIPRAEFDLPNPVTSVGADEIAHSGTTNLTDYLKRIPSLIGSLGDFQTSGYNTPYSADGSSLGGLNLLDLRNLGYVRTLVLVDGHRMVSESTGSAAVDIDSIPIAMIDRVEVATGGASAVYGADGVSGVVNFIMKHDLEGVHARVQAGASQDGGGNKYLSSVTIGHNFDDDRGNLTMAFEESYQDRLFFTQRSFTKVGGFTVFVANPNDPNDDPNIPDFIPTNNAEYTYSAPDGAIDTDLNYRPDRLGDGSKFHHGTNIGNASAIGSSGMPYANDLQGDFQPRENRAIAQVDGNYEFSNYFRFDGELKYAHVDTKSFSYPTFDDFTAISPDNAFMAANVARRIAANGVGLGILSEDYLQLRNAEQVDRDTYRGVFDLAGDLPSARFLQNFKYEASYVYGQTDVDDIQVGNRVEDRFFAALDSVIDPATGRPTCRSNLNPSAVPPNLDFFGVTNGNGDTGFTDTDLFDASRYPATFTPGPNSGCVPFDPFDPHADNRASIAFMTADTHVFGKIAQQVLNGYVSADVPQFQDWGFAKPLTLVLGGEHRKESSRSTPDALTAGDYVWIAGTAPVKGSFDVSEEFAEVSLPMVEGQRFVDELSFDGAVRQSHYSTAGDSTSWKLGGIYAPVAGLKLRGTDAVAVRAPNIGELFAPQQLLGAFVDDPCDRHFVNNGTAFRIPNCVAIMKALGVHYEPGQTSLSTGLTTPNLISGNASLKPETARTLTGGLVLQPPQSNWSLTMDWYRVQIADAIQAPSAQDVANECVDLSTIDNPFCAATTRTTTGVKDGAIGLIETTQINVASYETSGVDFSALYHFETQALLKENDGAFDFHLNGNYLNTLSDVALPGQAPRDDANYSYGGADGSPSPRWQANLDIVWTLDPLTIDYNIDWYSGVLQFSPQTTKVQPDIVAPQYLHLPPRFVQSVQVDYEVTPGVDVYGGADNLFYQKPSIGQNGLPVDPLGRFFYIGITTDRDLAGMGL